jgi:hypothetical protein
LKIFLALCGAMVTPLVISLLLKIDLFSFSEGSVESWIAFWGSYAGALIGAATVYLVTRVQINKNEKLQLEAIKLENENALKREMQQFQFTNRLKKLEEFDILIEDILDLVQKCANDYTLYIGHNKILFSNQKLSIESTEYSQKIIRDSKDKHIEWFQKLAKNFLAMRRLNMYIEVSHHLRIVDKYYEEFTGEIISGYYRTDSYLNYGDDPGEVPFSYNNLSKSLKELKTRVLEPKLRKEIQKMNV